MKILPPPRSPRLRGGKGLKQAFAYVGKQLKPILKSLANQYLSRDNVKRIKEFGSELVTDGSSVLTNLAKRKMMGGATPAIYSPSEPHPLISPPIVVKKRRKRTQTVKKKGKKKLTKGRKLKKGKKKVEEKRKKL